MNDSLYFMSASIFINVSICYRKCLTVLVQRPVCSSSDWISPARSPSFRRGRFRLIRQPPVCFHCRRINVLVKTIDGLVHKRMGKPQYLLRDEFRKLERLYNNKPVLQYNYELRRAYLAPPL